MGGQRLEVSTSLARAQRRVSRCSAWLSNRGGAPLGTSDQIIVQIAHTTRAGASYPAALRQLEVARQLVCSSVAALEPSPACLRADAS